MENKTTPPLWMGRPVVRAEHVNELERDAAINEFHSKMPRHQAEEKAHHDYMRRQHIDAAAHHLQGMKAAQANADMEDAKKHGAMYEMHLKALGFEPGPVPHEIKQAAEHPDRKPVYRFKPHHGDFFVLPSSISDLNKSEEASVEADCTCGAEDLSKKDKKPFHGYNPKKHAKTGGLNDKYREKYNRETGSDLKRPSKDKDNSRHKSFCARMKGVKGPTSKDGKLTPKGAALKRWNCSKAETALEFDSLEKSMSRSEMDGHLKSFGWVPVRSTKEEYYHHPVITPESHGLVGKTIKLTLSHSHGSNVPTDKMRMVLKDAGLEFDGKGGVQASKKHPFYKLYQKSGHVSPDENPMKTWNSSTPGVQHVEISKLVPTKNVPDSDSWKVDKHISFLRNNQSVPHITAKQDGKKFLVQDGHDVLAAAQRAGMTHAPVLVNKF